MASQHTPRRSNTLPVSYGNFAESHIDLRLKNPSQTSPIKQRPQPTRAETGRPTPTKPQRPTKSRTSSLFNLFSRPKAEKARGYHEPLPAPPRPRSPPPLSLPERGSTRLSTRSPTPQPQPQREYVRPPRIPERSPSRASVRSTKSNKTVKINRVKSDNDASHRLDSAWEPPPLFQAYPQAVKHTVLAVPDPADSKNGQESRAKTNRLSGFFGRNTTRLETPVLKVKPRKIFMLTTSGYILQYQHDGPSDRLPERTMRLGRHSVAFASDLVPGKPFVLQVLQVADNSTHVETPEKSFLSKFGLQSGGVSRTVPSLLLVFEEPEHMNEWMIAVRREIELLGGKKFSRTTTRSQPDNSDTMSISSQRYRGLQRTASMKSGRSIKAPSVTSIPSLPVSPQLYSPIISFDSNNNTPQINTGSEWSSSASAYGPSQRSSEGTTFSEQPVTPVTTPGGDDRTTSLVSKYHAKPSQRTVVPSTPEFNMHDLLTPEATPSPYIGGESTFPREYSSMFLYEIMDSPSSSPVPRSRSRAGEAFQPVSQSRNYPQPTSIAKGYRGWSTTPASRHPPMPPLPTSPTTPTIEINGTDAFHPPSLRSISHTSNQAVAKTTLAENHAPIAGTRPPPDIPLYRQKSSPTLPYALLATPTDSPFMPLPRQRPPPTIRNSSSPIPLRTSQLYLSSPLSLPRSRSPSPLQSPLTPPLPEVNPLRRPASLPVRSDPVPFLSSVRPNGLALSNSSSYRSVSSNHAADLRSKQLQRASIQVPIIRPGTIKNRNEEMKSLKTRKSVPVLPLLAIPPSAGPPPSKALPAVPVVQ